MPASKRAKRKYSPHKRWARATVGASLQSWDSWILDDSGHHQALLLDRVGYPMRAEFFDYVDQHPRQWRLQVIAKNRLPNGEEEHDVREIDAPGFKLEDLETAYQEIKVELKQQNPDAFDIGWIARVVA